MALELMRHGADIRQLSAPHMTGKCPFLLLAEGTPFSCHVGNMTQKEALDILKSGQNVFLTGCAGSGKTYLLERFILYLRFQKIPVGITASTGVAATHLSGITIHSWSGIGIKESLSENDITELLKRPYLRRRFFETKVLIIDEVSMLSSLTLEGVDRLLRECKQTDEPFGGIQLVLCGDFFQLPPVGKTMSSKEFLYKSRLWEDLQLNVCYLDRPYRQDDSRFLSMLNEIRENNISKATWETLKERFIQPVGNGVIPAKLYTHNAHADVVNTAELAKISGVAHTYMMQTTGNTSVAVALQKNCLAPERLVLKRGAQVMFVKNNAEAGYVNGTMGKVITFADDGYPVVRTFDGNEIVARPQEWEIEDPSSSSGDVIASITQVPLRLAWAITIHKSQGMSLDAAEIDLGKSFVEGLGYVALSRVRTLEGIKLRSINRTALRVSEDVKAFDKKLRQNSDNLAQELRHRHHSQRLRYPSRN